MKKSPREFIHKYNQFIRDYNLLMANITEYLWYTGNETIPFTVYNWLFFFFPGILWVIPIFPIRPPTEAPVWNRQKTPRQRSFQQPGGVHPPTRLVSNADLFWADLGDNPDPDHPWDWYIYLHLVDSYGKCREIYHTWILWEINNRK